MNIETMIPTLLGISIILIALTSWSNSKSVSRLQKYVENNNSVKLPIEFFINNCFLKTKKSDINKPIFYGNSKGIYARLDGYAIVPIEEYFALIEQPLPDLHVE